ncbi:MAG: STT3 domain-containing protein [Acidobacteriota bacterium]
MVRSCASDMRRELVLVAVIAVAALAIRVYPAWDGVFRGDSVRFLETDAWYHVRLVENQVHNFPWRVSVDPYAAAGGQYVPIAPLYDTLTSAAVLLIRGRDAETEEVERIAAFVPPTLGMLAVIAVWTLGRLAFGGHGGLFAAALLAVLPGHFLDRTTLGFVDHHALEALLATTTLAALVYAVKAPSRWSAAMAGASLGLYLLTWASGAFLLGILTAWLVTVFVVAPHDTELAASARATRNAALVALVLVLVFQDPAMHRYGSQVIGLIGLAALGLAMSRPTPAGRFAPSRAIVVVGIGTVLAGAVALLWWLHPTLLFEILTDVGRLAPDPARMGVLEARPLFLYSGEWSWLQPWQFFRSGFYVGVMGLAFLWWRVWRSRQASDALIGAFGVATLIATIGQNRFGYYWVPACATVGGWLLNQLVDWGQSVQRDAPTLNRVARELLVAVAVAFTFGPCLAPATLLTPRVSSLADHWKATMDFLRTNTPAPFGSSPSSSPSPDFYLARYRAEVLPRPRYTVMNWWDHGYWLIARARRVPVANPTQARASNAALFYAATDEGDARARLTTESAGYVLADWELPFRMTEDGRIMGRFQNVLDWAGAAHAAYYDVYYRHAGGAWTPVWVFHQPYYESMAFRLVALGGQASVPDRATSVMTFAERTDATGRAFREVLTERLYATYEQAQLAASIMGGSAVVVGLDPWKAAFPVGAVPWLTLVYEARTPEQAPSDASWVKVFQVR